MDGQRSSRFRALMSRRFPALGYHDFRLLWMGQMVSIAGSQMQNVAINWQIYQRTNSAVVLGLIGLVRVIPIIIFSLVGGAVADSYNRRRILFLTQSVMMAAALGLALVTALRIDDPVIILTFTAITSAAAAFDNPARQSLIPNLVAPEHLTNAVSLNTLVFQAGMIIGPALSGVVIDSLGVDAVYFINAATFLAVIIALWQMRLVEAPRVGQARPNMDSVLEGLKFVRSNPMIFSTMILDFIATFFSSATALLPIFARDILGVGAKGLGILYAAESVGSLVAGFCMSLIGQIKRRGYLLLGAVAAYGTATAIYGLSTNFYLSIALLALVGAGDSISTVLRQTIRSIVTPDYIRGRMTSVNMIFVMGGPQLGNLESGLLAGMVGAPMSVVIGGVATVIAVGVTAFIYPKLRDYK